VFDPNLTNPGAVMSIPSTQSVMATRLSTGDLFPHLKAQQVGGGPFELPQALAGSWSVILFYRGHWCPFCRSQLTDFQKHADQYAAAGIKVVALSVDTRENAQKSVDQHHLTFPVGYDLDPQATSALVGNYLSDGSDGLPTYFQATGFVLTPEGQVALALYSSGAVGRLNAADTLGFVKYSSSKG